MLFTSYEFICFLAVVFLLYYLLPGKWQWPFLLLASYIFYFIANPLYVIYIAFTITSTWYVARKMQKKKDVSETYFAEIKKQMDRQQRKEYKELQKKKQFRWMLLALLSNLGILAVVKYTNFVIANLNTAMQLGGIEQTISFVSILVPMGISFYTFQAMGYLIDVYRGKYRAEENLAKFALFVSFFPQLVQGPISRYDALAKSLYEPHKANWKTISFGLQRILWGFFKKLVVADRILTAVNTIIRNTDQYRGVFVLVGMLFYALELYADFTGGIDITIGVAQTMGITVAENFERPYFSKNIKEYWNRWHITMGSWFTDYIFYPISVWSPMLKLGRAARKYLGNAIGKRVPVYLASFVVWFTTGIWHGASWNFIAWGIGNFVVIMISQELEPCYRWFHKKYQVQQTFGFRLFQVVRTVLLMSCLRMFDCYRSVSLTFQMFGSMFVDFRPSLLTGEAFLGLGLSLVDYLILIAATILLLAVSLLQRKESVRKQIARQKMPIRFLIWYGLFLCVLFLGAYGHGYDASQFIYNQF